MNVMTAILAATVLSGSTPPDWQWQQILATQRIGGRLSAITVDERDPNRIFVGTEEGSIIRSLDGGVTWQEFELSQAVIKSRSMGLTAPGLPRLGATQPPDLNIFVEPPFSPVAGRVSVPFDTLFFSIRPDMIFAGFIPPVPRNPEILLGEAVNRRSKYTRPVQRIAICPQLEFPLLVATTRELYGSPDNGRTYVRLFALPGTTYFYQVACGKGDSKDVAVGTSFGLFVSKDGGLSFDQNLTGRPGQPTRAVHFGGTHPVTGDPTLYAAIDEQLYKTHPKLGLDPIYPDYKNASTAPWKGIRWISTSGSRRIWIATKDGLRRSADGGRNWFVPARTLFERHSIWQVEAGTNENGGERVVVLVGGDSPSRRTPLNTEDTIYSSDDGGETWHPFFNAISRRSFHQIAQAPGPDGVSHWWIVTSGGVWTTRFPVVSDGTVNSKIQKWARQKLATNPPLPLLLNAMLNRLGVSEEKIEENWAKIRKRNWFPRINARFDVLRGQSEQTLKVRGSNTPENRSIAQVAGIPADYAHLENDLSYEFFINARWSLYYTNLAVERFTFPRKALYELRRQVGFATEDAWHERVMHLSRLSRGMSDTYQIETLRARVDSLDAFLEIWLGGPLEELR